MKMKLSKSCAWMYVAWRLTVGTGRTLPARRTQALETIGNLVACTAVGARTGNAGVLGWWWTEMEGMLFSHFQRMMYGIACQRYSEASMFWSRDVELSDQLADRYKMHHQLFWKRQTFAGSSLEFNILLVFICYLLQGCWKKETKADSFLMICRLIDNKKMIISCSSYMYWFHSLLAIQANYTLN